MLRKLRIKFVCINMGIVVAMLAVIFGLLLGFTRQNLEQDNLALMRSALAGEDRGRNGWMEPPEGQARPGELPEKPEPEWRDFSGQRGKGLRPYILVELDENGAVVFSEGAGADDAEALEALAAAALDCGKSGGVLEDLGVRFLREDRDGAVRLVFTDLERESSTFDDLLRTCVIVGAASLAVFFVLSLLLACWAIHPVEEAWKAQKQFVSDASHELKTPLTVIMTNAELLQSGDCDSAARARFGENILTMSRQMRGLVESLLELARVDNASRADVWEEVDLSRVWADALLPFEPLCFEKDLPLQSELAPGVRVRGTESRLRQVLEILLDNAQKYADPGSELRVTLTKSGRSCTLSVADRGAPIPKEDQARLFERFYRADRARGRDGSYGLGLAIAQKIVENHRGKIWCESENGWNTFFVTLPALT